MKWQALIALRWRMNLPLDMPRNSPHESRERQSPCVNEETNSLADLPFMTEAAGRLRVG